MENDAESEGYEVAEREVTDDEPVRLAAWVAEIVLMLAAFMATEMEMVRLRKAPAEGIPSREWLVRFVTYSQGWDCSTIIPARQGAGQRSEL